MAEDYVKSYEQYSKNIEQDSSKDDLNKLILTLQKMAQSEQNEGQSNAPAVSEEQKGSPQIEESKASEFEKKKRKYASNFFYTGDIRETMSALRNFEDQSFQQIEYVLLVGFHHLVGSQIEFIYPPLEEDGSNKLTPDFLQKISQKALPDGSHLPEYGQVFFILQDENTIYHCVSSYGRIDAKTLV